jgi:hypothetical protein
MIDVREAVVAAQNYFNSVQDLMSHNRPLDVRNLRLEEVEISEDKKYWVITFGYDLRSSQKETVASKENRHYKILKVNTNSGEVESMKIREL